MGWTFYSATGQQLRATADKAATQAEMETGTSTSAYVTPGRTHYHPGVAKVWGQFQVDVTLDDHYNVGGMTDHAPGSWTIEIADDFSSANYAVSWNFRDTSNTLLGGGVDAKAVGSFQLRLRADDDSLTDPSHHVMFMAMGDTNV